MEDAQARPHRSAGSTFGDALATAKAGLSNPRPRLEAEAQLSACRALASKLPATALSPADSAALLQLVLQWLSLPTQPPLAAAAPPAPAAAAAAPAAAATPTASALALQLQLQRESLGLLLWVARDGRARPQLQPAAANQVLQQLAALYTVTGPPLAAGHAAAGLHDAGRAELLCCAADALGALPQLAAPAARQQAAVQALDVLVRALEGLTRGSGAQRDAALLVKLLKAFQALVAEAKKDHGCNLGALIPSLQRLLSFGLHDQSLASPLQRGHQKLSVYPATGAQPVGAPAAPARSAAYQLPSTEQQAGPPVQPHTAAASYPPQHVASGLESQLARSGGPAPNRRGSYVPPHLRRATAPTDQPAAAVDGSSGSVDGGSSNALAAPQQGTAVGPRVGVPQQQSGLTDTGPALPSTTGSNLASTVGGRWGRSSSSSGNSSAGNGPWDSGSGSRRSSTGSGSTRDAAGSPQRRSTAGAARSRRQSGLDSSDSEVSDSEGPGAAGARASRVRLGVLAVLQVLAKADPKAFHPSWTTLLPTSDTVLSPAPSPAETTLAHVLLHDPLPKVRQAAAVTIATLLEGPAQRAYLGIAECTDWERQPVRGFLSLSLSLGLMAVALHTALMHALHAESDPAVVLCVLRALGMLLLGAPYHRLSPALLLRCVQSLQDCLQQAAVPGSPPSTAQLQSPLTQEAASLAAACLSCLAAAFGTRQPSAALTAYLQGQGASTSTVRRASSSSSSSPSGRSHAGGANAAATGAGAGRATCAQRQALVGTGQALVQLLFSFAACGTPSVELEAVMALRGLAQQYCGALEGQWDRVARVAEVGARVAVQMVPPSPRSQQDGTLMEKLAHQSIRLAGDYLAATDPQAAASSSSKWQDPEQPGFSLPPRRQGSAGWRESQQHPKVCPSAAVPAAVRLESDPLKTAKVVLETTTEPAGLPQKQQHQHQQQHQQQEQQQHAQRWQALAQSTLGPAMAHSSPLARSAVYAVIAGLSAGTYTALPAPLQQQLLQWACSGATQEEGSPVRAAAIKATGALAASPCVLALHKGPELVLASLQASCHDTVLAVRVQAAPALAVFCHALEAALSHLSPAASPAGGVGAAFAAPGPPLSHVLHTRTNNSSQDPPGSSAAAGTTACCDQAGRQQLVVAWRLLPALLGLATHAALDSEKVKASGVEALGHCFACIGWCARNSRGIDSSKGHGTVSGPTNGGIHWDFISGLDDGISSIAMDAAGAALLASLQSPVPKVQWSACSAAGLLLLGCSWAEGFPILTSTNTAGQEQQQQPGWVGSLLQLGNQALGQLLNLLSSCPSMRSRVKASQALGSLPSLAWCPASSSYQGEVLLPVSAALFEGKACGFLLPMSAGQPSDPADATLKTELESTLVLTLLHLLSLAPEDSSAVEAPARGPVCENADLLQAVAALAAGKKSGCAAGGAVPLQQYWKQLCSLVGAALREGHAGNAESLQNVEQQYSSEFELTDAAVALAPGAAAGLLRLALGAPSEPGV